MSTDHFRMQTVCEVVLLKVGGEEECTRLLWKMKHGTLYLRKETLKVNVVLLELDLVCRIHLTLHAYIKIACNMKTMKYSPSCLQGERGECHLDLIKCLLYPK